MRPLVAFTLTGVLTLLAVPAAFAQEPRVPSVQRGYELLEQGLAEDAKREFLAVLARNPRDLGAREGLVWTYMKLGRIERALEAADRRMELAPADAEWRRKRLDLLGQVPDRRAEAIRGYRDLVRDRPMDVDLRLELARLLSWSPGRLEEAIAVYRGAVSLAPESRAARLGLARTLVWAGKSEAARPLLRDLHAEDSADPEAALLLAQAARGTGDLPAASRVVRRGLEAHPAHAGLRTEEGWIEVARGNLGAARTAARRALAADEASEEAQRILDVVDEATPTRLGARATYSSENTPFRRFVIGMPFEGHPWTTTRVRLRPHYTWFRDSVDVIERQSLGAELRQDLPWNLRTDLYYGYHQPQDVAATHEFDATLSIWPGGPLTLRGGGRQRAIVDEPRGYEDVAFLRGIGSGGTTLAGIEERLQVLEGYAGLTLVPSAFLYAYADGSLGQVSDEVDNRRRSVAAGLGLNVLRALDVLPAHDLTLKYDYFYLSYAEEERPEYFSPEDFQVHTPGAEYRVRLSENSVIGIEGGVPLRSGEPTGYSAGAFFRLYLTDRLFVEARWRKTDDTEFVVESATVGLALRF